MVTHTPLSAPHLRALSRDRLADANALYAAGRYDAAAYLTGYVLEAGLKARIVKHLHLTEYPEREATFRTHDLAKLSWLGGLQHQLSADPVLATNWSIVSDWDVIWRYRRRFASQTFAHTRLQALTDAGNGVFTWLQKRW